MNAPPPVTLVPFTADRLDSVAPWFDDHEVQRRLGDRRWPARELDLLTRRPGGSYRGRTVLRAHSWVALDEQQQPVAHLGGEVYDRWTRYGGEGPSGPLVLGAVALRSMGLTYLVDPARWRQGFGRAALRTVICCDEVADVRMFVAGIDADNTASQRCAQSAGFSTDHPEPDWEDTIYHHFIR
ncbi:MAG: GNAT family N-acetyltransferase [Propionibacteriales bacterium]|nr:GNAT family N-acetyltransferase [Propionibacteriales bacterium]